MALHRIGGAVRQKASEQNRNKKPDFATLLCLLSALAWRRDKHGGGWTIILGQQKILDLRSWNVGKGVKRIARSSLNRQLAGLEELGYVHRLQRHYRTKGGEVRRRKSLFTFGLAAIEFIRLCERIGRLVRIPQRRLRVPFSVQHHEDYLKPSGARKKLSAVDKWERSRPPRVARG